MATFFPIEDKTLGMKYLAKLARIDSDTMHPLYVIDYLQRPISLTPSYISETVSIILIEYSKSARKVHIGSKRDYVQCQS